MNVRVPRAAATNGPKRGGRNYSFAKAQKIMETIGPPAVAQRHK